MAAPQATKMAAKIGGITTERRRWFDIPTKSPKPRKRIATGAIHRCNTCATSEPPAARSTPVRKAVAHPTATRPKSASRTAATMAAAPGTQGWTAPRSPQKTSPAPVAPRRAALSGRGAEDGTGISPVRGRRVRLICGGGARDASPTSSDAPFHGMWCSGYFPFMPKYISISLSRITNATAVAIGPWSMSVRSIRSPASIRACGVAFLSLSSRLASARAPA